MAVLPGSDNRKSVQNLLFGFHGRIDRQWWWLGMVAIIAIQAALGELNAEEPTSAKGVSDFRAVFLHINGWSLSTLDILTFWPAVALDVKRWHDLDMSGACALLSCSATPAYIAIVLFQLGGPLGQPNAFDFAFLVALALTLGSILVLGFARGTRGPNRFGLG